MSFIALGSILIGVAVITGLMKDGEMGFLQGGCLLFFLLIVLIIGGLATFLISLGSF